MKEKNKEMKAMILTSVCNLGRGYELADLMSTDEAVELILNYINTHKWFINLNTSMEYSCTQATFSWFENVFRPLMYAMDKSLVYMAFPERSRLEIFQHISELHYLRTSNVFYIPYEKIIREYILETSERKIVKLLVRLFY